MQPDVGLRHWALVVSFALVAAAGECGHDQAKEPDDEPTATSKSAQTTEKTEKTAEGDRARRDAKTGGRSKSEARRVENPDVDRKSVEKLVRDNTAFGFELYRQLQQIHSGENLVFAPYNLSRVLAMVLPGARGATQSEMRDALQLRLEAPTVHRAFNLLDATLESAGSKNPKSPGGAKGEEGSDLLETASGVWSQQGLSVKSAYRELLAKQYGAELRRVDFRSAPDEARSRINEWTARATHDEIRELLPPNAVDPKTRLILTAAVYFRGRWASTFEKDATRKEKFHNTSGEATEVPMMHQKLREGYRFAEGSKYRAVELPYASGAFSMVVVLPAEGSFSEVESGLDAVFVQSVFENLEPTPVDLALPKFEFSTKFSAASSLQKLGMKSAFSKSADFSGMTTSDLVLDDVLHKAFISVDEKGTVAAAASAAAMQATSMPMGEPEFEEVTVDRPFFVLLRHRGTNTLVFAGRVVSL